MLLARPIAPARRAVALVAVTLLMACGRGAISPTPTPTPAPDPALDPPPLRTTDGALATRNFEAELALAERQHAERPADVGRTRALVDRLLTRAQFFGRLADYDEVESLGLAAVAGAPGNGDAHLLRARSLAALHAFAGAVAELDRAAALGADREAIRHLRVGIWAATGDIDRALGPLRGWRRAQPGLPQFAAEAGALADARDFPRAEALFTEARRHYDDVSPFAVAWLELQEGHMWQSAGRSDRARPLFEAALARLPGYAAAGAHLAQLVAAFGDPEGRARARALLEDLVSRTDDPEYLGQLGALYRQLHRTTEGDRLVARAARRYEVLLARHPAAFYDHAARFFLHVGGDPTRALDCARKNLAIRQTLDARDLLAEAERATAQTSLITP
jgi:tetratricopeptide (TPR) repeat protein